MPSKRPWNWLKKKGAYPAFKGSEWETGAYFTRRGYTSDRWKQLAADVAKYGIRNGYLMAVAPTGSTSNIANTTAGIDPIFKKFFIEEKKGSFTPKTAPDLNDKNFLALQRGDIQSTNNGPSKLVVCVSVILTKLNLSTCISHLK